MWPNCKIDLSTTFQRPHRKELHQMVAAKKHITIVKKRTLNLLPTMGERKLATIPRINCRSSMLVPAVEATTEADATE
ncbi:MAG: hypothetical protein M1830_006336, partial [Pleopsidium flavum]